MDLTASSSPGHGMRRRAAKACQFCRRRKMKCDNQEPQCTNCKTYSKECSYVDLPKSSRPSKSRLSNLEEENRRLHERLNNAQPLNASPQATVDSPNLHLSAPPATVPPINISLTNGPERNYSGSRNPGNNQSNYYGRTSALFDDDPVDRSAAISGASRGAKGGPSDRTEMQLMGEAAKQRQMEMINYNSGKLDFDGVNPELGMHLLSVHWNRQHHSHLITYRPAFMRDMACEGPYFSKLLLNAIYFGASKFSPRAELRNGPDSVRSAGQQFRQRVRELLGGALDRSEITTIQALLIMTSSLFALGDERSAAWLYAGTAFRMIIDLGLHVDDLTPQAAQRLSEEDIEIRRRVFWGAFVVDKIQSLYQGRPMSLQEADTRVAILFQDRYEELEHWMPTAYVVGTKDYRGSPAYSVSTFTELCRLSVMMNDILNSVYAEKSSKRGPVRLAEDLKRIQASLEEWEASLPLHLSLDSVDSTTCPPPHVLSLQAMYNVLLILLHRPFVSEGHLHSTSPSIPANSFVVCAQAATKIVYILRIYDQTFSIQHAPYLISYATYVSATIHVRIAAQKGPGSEAQASLATCLSVFDKNQETNWAVRRAKSVILNLMIRMKVALPENTAVQSQTLRAEKTANPASPRSARLVQNNVASPIVRSPELDIDQIIQSFIYEQQNSFGNMPDQYRFQGPTTENPQNAGPMPVDGALSQNLQPMSYDMGYHETPWMVENQPNGSAEDMLFGFNGAGLDYLW